MEINVSNINFNTVSRLKKKEMSLAASDTEAKPQEKAKVSGSLAAAVYGIKKSDKAVKPDKAQNAQTYVKNLPFAKDLSPEDKRNLTTVLKNGDKEADYMQKLINLVCEEKVTPSATQTLCEHGVMSDLVKQDIDTYYDKVIGQGLSVKDAFLPEHKSIKTAEKATNVGDVFRVAGKDNIYVKTGDNSSTQLEMDADTYLKLFPPIDRFSNCQNSNGDCFFLSSVNSIMENPTTRAAVYNCFTQDGNDVIVHLPDGSNEVRCPNGELPEGYNKQMYSSGSAGMKLLEHMYGYQIESQKYEEYQDFMYEEIELMEEKLDKLASKSVQDEKTVKKQENLSKKIANFQSAAAQVDEMMTQPLENRQKAFVLNDLGDFVTDKNGIPMIEDVNKIDSNCTTVSNYYIGIGGDADVVTQNFGFDSESYEVGMDDDYIDEALFAENPDDYLIAATTYEQTSETDDEADDGSKVEKAQNKSYSIYSRHAYKILPFDDENGNRMFKVTNPWNQSHRVIMDESTLKKYFEEFAITSLNGDFDDE